jgi:molybdopterin/thiamine biosynthesis adenylyltransferase/rhodanese-related sulfurtransferase
MNTLTQEEVLRYGRHLVMPEITVEGQERLKAARILCVGAGGLGSPISLYLAAAGVGTLGLVDDDVIDLSNIQRQVLYATEDVGRPKAEAALERISGINPHVEVELHETRLVADNAMEILAGYDVIVDGSDNFPTRYLVNDASVLLGKPVVFGSVLRFDGQVSVFDARQGPCYRCLFPEPPPPGSVPSCAEGGVLGVLPGIVGSLQALEALKLILGRGEPLVGRLLLFEGLGLDFREVAVGRDPDCAVCGQAPSITKPGDLAVACGAAPEAKIDVPAIAPEDLAASLGGPDGPRLLDVRRPEEIGIAELPGALTIPLAELPGRLDELARDMTWVISCHKGARAKRAWQLMHDAGFVDIRILEGGIDAWAERIDPTLNRYT